MKKIVILLLLLAVSCSTFQSRHKTRFLNSLDNCDGVTCSERFDKIYIGFLEGYFNNKKQYETYRKKMICWLKDNPDKIRFVNILGDHIVQVKVGNRWGILSYAAIEKLQKKKVWN